MTIQQAANRITFQYLVLTTGMTLSPPQRQAYFEVVAVLCEFDVVSSEFFRKAGFEHAKYTGAVPPNICRKLFLFENVE